MSASLASKSAHAGALVGAALRCDVGEVVLGSGLGAGVAAADDPGMAVGLAVVAVVYPGDCEGVVLGARLGAGARVGVEEAGLPVSLVVGCADGARTGDFVTVDRLGVHRLQVLRQNVCVSVWNCAFVAFTLQ